MKTKVAYIGLKVREENWRRDMDLGIVILKRLDEVLGEAELSGKRMKRAWGRPQGPLTPGPWEPQSMLLQHPRASLLPSGVSLVSTGT